MKISRAYEVRTGYFVVRTSLLAEEVGDDRSDEDEGDEDPGEALETGSGLADTEGLVRSDEVAGEALALTCLQQDNARQQDARNDDQNDKNRK